MASAAAEAIAKKHNAEVTTKAAGTGHNSDPSGTLKSYAQRLQALTEEKNTLSEDIRELKAEAKEAGVDPKALAAVVKIAMEDADKKAKRVAHEEKVDHYRAALSLLD